MHTRWLVRAQLLIAGLTLAMSIQAATFSVPGVPIRFEAPEGLTPLTAEEIRSNYPRGQPPSLVLGHKNLVTSIVVEAHQGGSSVPPMSLEALKAGIETSLEDEISEMEWLRREIIELHGHRWVHFELTYDTRNTSTHNMVLVTVVGAQYVFVHFNSTREEFPQWGEKLRASLQSIQVTAGSQ